MRMTILADKSVAIGGKPIEMRELGTDHQPHHYPSQVRATDPCITI